MTNHVTYSDLFTFALVIVGVIALLLQASADKPETAHRKDRRFPTYIKGDNRHREAAILLHSHCNASLREKQEQI